MSMDGTTPKLWAVSRASTGALLGIKDPMAVSGATLSSPADGTAVDLNVGTGRAYDLTFIWERYSSSSVDEMQLQIATDPDFNAVVYDQVFTGIATDTIAQVIGPTGSSTSTPPKNAEFNPGGTYYWRVRAKDPMYSPWTEGRSFTIGEADVFVITGPETGAADTSLMPTFSWSEYPDAIGYEIMLSEDPTFAIIEWSYNVDNPFYKVEEELKYSTTYYWRVRGVTGEPYLQGRTWITPAGPWVTGVFTTMAEPVPDEPDVITITEPAAPPDIKVIEVPGDQPVIPTYLLWVIVGVGAVLIIALIVLIVRTRRVA
jgi:hypothetical protein